jgi:hypothetical protein
MKAPTLVAVPRHRGTEFSNPFPSSSESSANRATSVFRRERRARLPGHPRGKSCWACWVTRGKQDEAVSLVDSGGHCVEVARSRSRLCAAPPARTLNLAVPSG